MIIGVALAACAAQESSRRSSEAAFLPLSNQAGGDRQPDRVMTGMSFPEVEALMGQSQQTCWKYRDVVVERTICFRDKKVSVVSTVEDQPGKNQARIDAVFTTGEQARVEGQGRGLTLGMSPRQVVGLLGPPRVVVEAYDDSAASYRATFVDGKLATFQNVTPPVP